MTVKYSFWAYGILAVADQESGMAMANSKVIFPLMVEIQLHGFIKRYQGLKFNRRDISESCKNMLRAISSNQRLKKGAQEGFISSF
jgi:hypothetical protein